MHNTCNDITVGIAVTDPSQDSVLNAEIKATEIRNAIQHLKNKKAAGPDGRVSEMLKASMDVINLFNIIFQNGKFPKSWGQSMIVSIHQKGDMNNPDNYRPISLIQHSKQSYHKCY